jgi:hypothetical protein
MPFTKYRFTAKTSFQMTDTLERSRYAAVSTFRFKETQTKQSTTALSCTGPATYTRSLIYPYIHSVCIHTKLTNDCPLRRHIRVLHRAYYYTARCNQCNAYLTSEYPGAPCGSEIKMLFPLMLMKEYCRAG